MTLRSRCQSGLWKSTLAVVFLLLVVWQVPGSIGLRHGLLGLLLLWVLILNGRQRTVNYVPRHRHRAPLIWLGLLTGWTALVIMLWGVEPGLSWNEFRGQWLTALGAGLIGSLLARAALADSPQRVQAVMMTVFSALLAQVLLHDTLGVMYWASTGGMPFRQAPVLYLPQLAQALMQGEPWQSAFSATSPDKFSYVNNTLAAMLVAEIAQRLLLKKRWLNCSTSLLLVAGLAALLCSYWLQMRNGNVGLLLLLGMATLMLAIRLAQSLGVTRVVTGMLVVVLGIAGLASAMVHSDARWQKLMQTIPVALDTETHRVWLTRDDKYPRMENGEVVDISAYERLAWGKEGVKLILDHPLGSGYNRNAFGDGVDRKYEQNGKARGGHAHSGVIDFAIANGVVGLALWLTFLASLFIVGWQAFRDDQVGLGLTLMFLVSGFLGRSLVDSNIRDHVLQQFLFMALFFYGLVAAKQKGQPS